LVNRWFVEVWRQTFVLRQTGSVLDAQLKQQRLTLNGPAKNRKLGNEWRFIFDIHREIIRFEERRRFFEDGQQFAGGQSVIRVVREPRLQTAKEFGAKSAAAINEPFVHARHFGDVRVGRNFPAGGQEKPDVPGGILREQGFEFGQVHKVWMDVGPETAPTAASRQPRKARMASAAPAKGAVR